MTNWIPEWVNAYCPNCGKLSDIVYDTVTERRIKLYCKRCSLLFDISFSPAHINEKGMMVKG